MPQIECFSGQEVKQQMEEVIAGIESHLTCVFTCVYFNTIGKNVFDLDKVKISEGNLSVLETAHVNI